MQAFNFLILLPALIWWLLGACFVTLWRFRLTGWHCGVGFALTGTGFAVDMFPLWGNINPFVSGCLYIAAVLLYSQAVLQHFEVRDRLEARLGLAALYFVLHGILILRADDLTSDLILTDLVFAAMLAHAIIASRHKATNLADRFLLTACGLVGLDCIVRTAAFNILLPWTGTLDDFASSNYSTAVQVTTLTIGLLYPFSIIAAIATRAVDLHRNDADADHLTGLLNRRGFSRLVAKARMKDHGTASLLVADLDHFKRINDSFGHQTGDAVIRALSDDLKSILDGSAIIARFGGEEFVAYLPGRSVTDALGAGNRINIAFANRPWHELKIGHTVTVSIGISHVGSDELFIEPAIERADLGLYAAKRGGRNQVAVNSDMPLEGLAGGGASHAMADVGKRSRAG